MKNLYMIRHAKSDWKHNLSDFERGLNKRGLYDAPLMGRVLKDLSILPDIIITSSALRAKTTAFLLSHELGYKKEDVVQEDKLYLADVNTFYSVINTLHDSYNSAMIFSHNNGITDFVNSLSNANILNMPTCSIAHIRVDLASWSHITSGVGELMFFDFPKNHK